MTATTESTAGFDVAAFEAFLASRSEPDWITESRASAFDVFQSLSRAEADSEEWKRVDLRTFRPQQFGVRSKPRSTVTLQTLLRDRADFAGSVVHVDGHCTAADVDPDIAVRGAIFGDLNTSLVEHRERIEPHLMTQAVRRDADRFTAWHAAFRTGGTVLFVPRGVELAVPMHSLIALSADSGAADFSHTLVILEEGASATLLEETVSADAEAPGLHVGAVELLVGRGAHLRYVQLQNWNHRTWHFAHQGGRVANDGFLQWTVGGLGAKLAHVHQDVHLDGQGATGEVNGVTFATGRQLISYYTQQTHNAPDTRSDLLYKEVLRDRARVVWRGMIQVERGAQNSDGYQRSDALMLSPTARCDSIPGLEIETDEVRCTHGATTGRVDEEQIFYCMSRGMTRFEAMHMIVEGFFHQVYNRIPIEAVRETLSQAVERKLGIGQ